MNRFSFLSFLFGDSFFRIGFSPRKKEVKMVKNRFGVNFSFPGEVVIFVGALSKGWGIKIKAGFIEMFDHGNLRMTPPPPMPTSLMVVVNIFLIRPSFLWGGGSQVGWHCPFRLPYFGATKSSRRRNRSDVFNVSVFMEEVVPKSDRSVLVSGSQD